MEDNWFSQALGLCQVLHGAEKKLFPLWLLQVSEDFFTFIRSTGCWLLIFEVLPGMYMPIILLGLKPEGSQLLGLGPLQRAKPTAIFRIRKEFYSRQIKMDCGRRGVGCLPLWERGWGKEKEDCPFPQISQVYLITSCSCSGRTLTVPLSPCFTCDKPILDVLGHCDWQLHKRAVCAVLFEIGQMDTCKQQLR